MKLEELKLKIKNILGEETDRTAHLNEDWETKVVDRCVELIKESFPLDKPVILQGELLPCPFCGNKKVKIIEYEALGMWRCVQCDKCKGQFYFFNKGTNIGVGRGTTQQRKERIIEAWNKRAGREPQSK